MTYPYVHGYSTREDRRLDDQARTLAELLHGDTTYPQNSRVLEAGCGVGAQTVLLAQRSPQARITAIDISRAFLARAEERVRQAGCTNVTFQQADILDLPFPPATFDHAFVCFVLEHLANPVDALGRIRAVLKPGGTLTVIEGDHGSAFFYPESGDAQRAIDCQIALQAKAGGNARIGRALYPLLRTAGYARVRVSPRMVYVDADKPDLVDGFTKKTFTAMIEGIREQVLQERWISADAFDRGIRDPYRTTQPDGTFCYTFFKALAFHEP